MDKTEIFIHKPPEFTKPLVVAGGILCHQNRFLLLKRHPQKPYGQLWNLPAGKLEKDENPQIGAQREIFEETNILIPLDALKPLQIFYLKRGLALIQFHIYKTEFENRPTISLKLDENTEALWTSKEEAFKLPLLSGGKQILSYCLK